MMLIKEDLAVFRQWTLLARPIPLWAVLALLDDLEEAREALQPFADAWRTYGWRADGTPKYGPEMNPEWLRRAAEAGGQA